RLVSATTATGSTSHLITSIIANFVKEKTDSQIIISVIPTSGSADGLDRLAHREVNFMTGPTGASLYWASTLTGPYEGKWDSPVYLYAMFPYAMSVFHTVLKADSPIETWEDLEGKKLSLGSPNSIGAQSFGALLDIKGITEAERLTLALSAGLDALKDNKIDISFYQTGAPNPSVEEFATRHPMKFLDFDQALVDEFNKSQFGGTDANSLTTLSKETYVNMTRDAQAMVSLQCFNTGEGVPEEAAYWITKVCWENREELMAIHPALTGMLTEEKVLVIPNEIHAGAMKYYKEIGIF
ncbi:TAXI family TRAP transporter solute-binding subunit, partial [Chloroflexota bacterium]